MCGCRTADISGSESTLGILGRVDSRGASAVPHLPSSLRVMIAQAKNSLKQIRRALEWLRDLIFINMPSGIRACPLEKFPEINKRTGTFIPYSRVEILVLEYLLS